MKYTFWNRVSIVTLNIYLKLRGVRIDKIMYFLFVYKLCITVFFFNKEMRVALQK